MNFNETYMIGLLTKEIVLIGASVNNRNVFLLAQEINVKVPPGKVSVFVIKNQKVLPIDAIFKQIHTYYQKRDNNVLISGKENLENIYAILIVQINQLAP